MTVSAYPHIRPHLNMYCSISDPRYSFSCGVTSNFDLRIFCLLGSDSSLASRLFCDSSFLVGFRVRLDCRGVGEGNFGTRGEEVSFSSESESEDTTWIDELKSGILGGDCDFGSPWTTTERGEPRWWRRGICTKSSQFSFVFLSQFFLFFGFAKSSCTMSLGCNRCFCTRHFSTCAIFLGKTTKLRFF